MGFADRDYMRDREKPGPHNDPTRIRRGNAQPTPFGFLTKVVIFVGIVVVLAWAIDRFDNSLIPTRQSPLQSVPLSTQKQEQSSIERHTDPKLGPREESLVNYSNPANTNSRSREEIFKCVVNGNTTYSNEPCVTKTAQKNLVLNESQGIISPPKERLEDLTAKRHAAEAAYQRNVSQQIARPAQSPKVECEALNKYIEQLDSMSRQAQSGQMQDWIRQERQKARDRQFHILC